MSYQEVRRPKLIIGLVLSAILLLVFTSSHWGRAKENYFNYVFERCSEGNGTENVAWRQVLAFDAEVREFVSESDAGSATIECVNSWAGLFIADTVQHSDSQSPKANSKLTVIISGQNYAPPERIVKIRYTKFTAPQDASF